ncbi:hypothetical protein [Dyella sp.]|jgi:hypothetical protein|uniref:hypothetical protein n=1 Tax=Dyella sp. TaxID=1869338 RepID=UPI002D776BFB|nr:hypothetical protein [Dyella sp.]HET6433987.1 hypothetical protein [Dyella sp.]
MSRLSSPVSAAPDFSHWVAAISAVWLAVGAFALGLTPLPAHTAEAGWSPAFWLLLAPACALAGLGLRARRTRG